MAHVSAAQHRNPTRLVSTEQTPGFFLSTPVHSNLTPVHPTYVRALPKPARQTCSRRPGSSGKEPSFTCTKLDTSLCRSRSQHDLTKMTHSTRDSRAQLTSASSAARLSSSPRSPPRLRTCERAQADESESSVQEGPPLLTGPRCLQVNPGHSIPSIVVAGAPPSIRTTAAETPVRGFQALTMLALLTALQSSSPLICTPTRRTVDTHRPAVPIASSYKNAPSGRDAI